MEHKGSSPGSSGSDSGRIGGRKVEKEPYFLKIDERRFYSKEEWEKMPKEEKGWAEQRTEEIYRKCEKKIETRNRIIEATWRAIVKDDEVKPEDGVLQIQRNIRTGEGQEENRYGFMYKEELAAEIIERQQYCDYSYFLISDKISASELMEKMIEVAKMQQERGGGFSEGS